jgi:hypothetical protein
VRCGALNDVTSTQVLVCEGPRGHKGECRPTGWRSDFQNMRPDVLAAAREAMQPDHLDGIHGNGVL